VGADGSAGVTVRFWLKFAVSAALVWLVLRGCDLDELARRLFAVDPGAFLLACGLLLVLALPLALRWRFILARLGRPLALRSLVGIVLIGMFFNQLLPSSVGGDGVRVWRTWRAGLGAAEAVNAVLIDRMLGLTALLALAAAGLPFLVGFLPPGVPRAAVPLAILLGVGAIASVLLCASLPAALGRFRVIGFIRRLSVDLRSVLGAPRTVLPAMALSLLIMVVVVGVVLVLARGLGIGVGWRECLAVVPPSLLVMALPISVAGWGVREGAFVAGFGFVGVPATHALALSVLFGVANAVSGSPGGIAWLLGHARVRDVRRFEQIRSEGDPVQRAPTAAKS